MSDATQQNLMKLNELWRLMNNAYGRMFKRLNVSQNSYLIMDILYNNPEGIEPAVIADTLSLLRPAVAAMLKDMERKNLIIRKAQKKDLRRKHIILTDTGRELAGKVIEAVTAVELDALSHMTLKEQQILITASERFYRTVKDAADK